MISTYYIMIFLQRKPDLLQSIALAGLVILVWDTQQLFNIGFQLSFLAVLGIYGLHQSIIEIFRKANNSIYNFLINTFALSTSAQISVTPLTLYYFHQFSFLSIFINVISIAFAQVFIMISFILCVLFMINFTPNWLLTIYNKVSLFFLEMVKNFQNWDFSFTQNIPMEIPETIILFVIIYLLQKILILPNLKNLSKFLASILIFILVRSSINLYYWHKEEILTHHFYKQTIKNNTVIFFIRGKDDLNKIHKQIIKPYITSRRIDNVKIQTFPTKTKIRIRDLIYEIK